MFYVALTRSVWHCSLGGWHRWCSRRGDKKGDTDVHQSALGRLLQKGEPQGCGRAGCTAVLKRTYAMMILPGRFRHKLVITQPVAGSRGDHPAMFLHAELNAKTLQRLPGDNWRVTSYSGLQQRGFSGIARRICCLGWMSMPQALPASC
ncbi:hypothetical protein MJ391_22900 [Escherichia coli]|nr:hypothetical protein MJ391_22900 [Escherichia coli]